jgi:glucose-1-phosphate thymidylyltransferase
MKGIILAGGLGRRLRPLTSAISKQLLPVYDKPMIYYPLSTLMLAGIRETLVISTTEHLPAYRRLLGDGGQWGLSFSYAEQDRPRGLADAFRVGKEFTSNEPICLILGDNIFFGHGLPEVLRLAADENDGATIFAYRVGDPSRYAVVELDASGRPTSLAEKPEHTRSNYAVPGIYFYDGDVTLIAERLIPSERGELEITDVNQEYLDEGRLRVILLGRGVAWLDAGTHEALMQAGSFVQAVQERQGMMISCPEEIAYRMGFIDAAQLHKLAHEMADNSYKGHLLRMLAEEHDRVTSSSPTIEV